MYVRDRVESATSSTRNRAFYPHQAYRNLQAPRRPSLIILLTAGLTLVRMQTVLGFTLIDVSFAALDYKVAKPKC